MFRQGTRGRCWGERPPTQLCRELGLPHYTEVIPWWWNKAALSDLDVGSVCIFESFLVVAFHLCGVETEGVNIPTEPILICRFICHFFYTFLILMLCKLRKLIKLTGQHLSTTPFKHTQLQSFYDAQQVQVRCYWLQLNQENCFLQENKLTKKRFLHEWCQYKNVDTFTFSQIITQTYVVFILWDRLKCM